MVINKENNDLTTKQMSILVRNLTNMGFKTVITMDCKSTTRFLFVSTECIIKKSQDCISLGDIPLHHGQFFHSQQHWRARLSWSRTGKKWHKHWHIIIRRQYNIIYVVFRWWVAMYSSS